MPTGISHAMCGSVLYHDALNAQSHDDNGISEKASTTDAYLIFILVMKGEFNCISVSDIAWRYLYWNQISKQESNNQGNAFEAKTKECA